MMLRCSIERRHVIAAFLSGEAAADRFNSLAELGDFLATRSHDDVLRTAFAGVPTGFRGALGRGGTQPYTRRFYRYLHALMSTDSRPATTKLIMRLAKVNPTRLRIARALPRDFQTPSLVLALRSADQARDLSTLIRLLKASGVQGASIRASLASVSTAADVGEAAARLAYKVDLPLHPVGRSHLYRPVVSGAELARVALRFRNCARTYLIDVLDGQSSFAIVKMEDREAVVHLIREKAYWVVDGIHGPRNERPDEIIAKEALAHLAAHGIKERQRPVRDDGPWSCLRRLSGFGFGHDW